MLRIRSIVLGVDERIDEACKWKSPTFMFRFETAAHVDKKRKGLEAAIRSWITLRSS